VQLAAIMRTESTFSFGLTAVLVLEVVPVAVDVVLDERDISLSSEPVISTLWPTCALSFEASASSL
jgi:hypothetical protein